MSSSNSNQKNVLESNAWPEMTKNKKELVALQKEWEQLVAHLICSGVAVVDSNKVEQ